ncbi:MAG: metal-dependent hydrolase [Elusimicrobia bacterium]|nr:metal-dependent hydrolase [Elusimicrobiota bacterium]
MDNVTHTLAGAALGNAFFRERIGPAAAPILAIASNLPDIDAAVMLLPDPYVITWRRTFGHSLFLLPIWILGASYLLRRRYPDVSRPAMIGLVALGAAGHLLFDLVNSFGVVCLWPLSDWRPEFAIVFIIDLVLAGILAAPLLASIPAARRDKLAARSRLAVAACALYLLLCAWSRWAGGRLLARSGMDQGASWSYLFPEPFGPHRWRAVVRDPTRYRLYLIDAARGTLEPRGEIATDDADPRAQHAAMTPQGRRLSAFFKAPVWVVEPGEGADTVVRTYDLRFTSLVLQRAPGASFGFRFVVRPDGDVVVR